MGVSPIPFSGIIEATKPLGLKREVAPPSAVEPASRMADDSYGSERQDPERGLEDEDEATSEEHDFPEDTKSDGWESHRSLDVQV